MAAKILLVIISTLGLFNLRGQDLNGTFKYEEGAQSITYQFDEGSRFASSSANTFGHGNYLSKGYYILSKDSLLLFHEAQKSPLQPSSYEIIEQDHSSNKNILVMRISVLDDQRKPIKGATILCKNGDHIIFGELTDDEGFASFYTQGGYVKTLNISYTGFQVLDINLDDFWGSNSKIEVVLQKEGFNTYNSETKIEKFKVIGISENQISLMNSKDVELIFEKSN